jgi:transposase
MNRKAYPTDLKDAECELLEPLLPKAKPGGRPRSVALREILNGIFYRERTGCTWEMLPHDLPSAKTVYDYFSSDGASEDGYFDIWSDTFDRRLHEQAEVRIHDS